MNHLELKKEPSGRFVTTIHHLGVKVWEAHTATDEVSVLLGIQKRNYYQSARGDWTITMPDEYKTFKDATFDKVISMAITYIHERDHPHWEDHF